MRNFENTLRALARALDFSLLCGMYEERALLLVDLPDVARECPLTDDAEMAFLDEDGI